MSQMSDSRIRRPMSLVSHRPRSTTSLRDLTPHTPISRLLLSALALTVASTWIRQEGSRGDSGGAGWCVLSYWGWRTWRDQRDRWKLRRGRKGVKSKWDISLTSLTVSFSLAVQSIAFFLSIGDIGPLRTAVLLACASLWISLFATHGGSMVLSRIPSVFCGAIVLWSSYEQRPESVFAPLILLIASLLMHPLIDTLRKGSQTKEKRTSLSSSSVNTPALLFSAFIVAILYNLNIIPSPLPNLFSPTNHTASAIIVLVLCRFAPLPTLSPSSRITHKLKGNRDHIILFLGIAAIQFFALPPSPSLIDVLAILPLFFLTSFLSSTRSSASADRSTLSMGTSSVKYWSAMSLLPPTCRPHVQTILRTPTSSRIFYFLLLNLAYMGVQMVYGVWTNSLGLISDAIHMLFDCLGLGVGLWASVAATWKPDGRYTYGYARVETLSGFANGCFLILISIFIIFEAVQRVLDPPEMETQQLLLVSTIGLVINLWGMYATGGHHHHGHSHGHGHDHGHSHSHGHGHTHAHAKKEDDLFINGHSNDNTQPDHAQHRVATTSRKSSTSSIRMARNRSSGSGHGFTAMQDLSNEHHDHHNHHGHHHDDKRGHHQHKGQHCDHEHDHTTSHNSHTHGFHGFHDSYDNHEQHKHHGHEHNHEDQHGHNHGLGHDHEHDHGDSHSHDDHGHSHDHAHSHNMRGVFLHVLADTLGSVGVIISTLLIRWTGWTGFDPLASLFIAGLIMASVIPLVIDSGKVLCLDVGPDSEEQIRAALSELTSISGLATYSSPRFWPRCEGEYSGSIHIQLAPSPSSVDPFKLSNGSSKSRRDDTIYANAERVVAAVEKVLKKRIRGLTELVVQVEGSEDKNYCLCMTGSG